MKLKLTDLKEEFDLCYLEFERISKHGHYVYVGRWEAVESVLSSSAGEWEVDKWETTFEFTVHPQSYEVLGYEADNYDWKYYGYRKK